MPHAGVFAEHVAPTTTCWTHRWRTQQSTNLSLDAEFLVLRQAQVEQLEGQAAKLLDPSILTASAGPRTERGAAFEGDRIAARKSNYRLQKCREAIGRVMPKQRGRYVRPPFQLNSFRARPSFRDIGSIFAGRARWSRSHGPKRRSVCAHSSST